MSAAANLRGRIDAPRGRARAKYLSGVETFRDLTDRERDEAEDLGFRLFLARDARRIEQQEPCR